MLVIWLIKQQHTMNNVITLPEAKRHIDSFSRPNGYSPYAWDVAKKLAMEAWNSYLNNRPFRRPVNYMCSEFYKMIQRPDNGQYIIPTGSIRMLNNG